MDRWEKCADIAPDDELRNWPLWVGIDLANKIDICAAVKRGFRHLVTRIRSRSSGSLKDGWRPPRSIFLSFTGNGLMLAIWI